MRGGCGYLHGVGATLDLTIAPSLLSLVERAITMHNHDSGRRGPGYEEGAIWISRLPRVQEWQSRKYKAQERLMKLNRQAREGEKVYCLSLARTVL